MSLLLDVLKRTRDHDAGKLQTPPAPSAGNPDDAPAHTGPAVTAKSHATAYIIAGLLLLAGSTGWYIHQLNRYAQLSSRIVTSQPAPSSAAPVTAQTASQAASGVAAVLAALPPTSSGGQSAKARTHRSKARRKPPEHIATAGPDPINEAYLALSKGDLDGAERQYLAVLAERPHEKDALLGLAVIAQRKRQTDRAATLYRQVLHEDMGNATAAAGIVNLSAIADPVAAESQLRELLDIKPDAPELHYALGNILARQSKWGDAQQSFYRACVLEPDNALYAYNLAVSLDHLHQTEALTYYQKALDDPGNSAIDRIAVRRRIEELNGTH